MKLFQVQIPDKSTVSVIMGVSSLFPIWYMFHLVFSCLTVRRSMNVLLLLIGLILNEVVNYVLKHYIQAPRPDFPFSGVSHGRAEDQVQENIFAVGVNVASHGSPPSSPSMDSIKRHDGFGMPSSHAQFMAFWFMFALLQGNSNAGITKLKDKKNQSTSQYRTNIVCRVLRMLFYGSISLLVCYSRIYLNYHTPLQVLAGFLIGVISCVIYVRYLSRSFLIPLLTIAYDLMAALFRSLNIDIDRVMQALILCE
ncbi:hypothetical protein MIR68_009270 [Amoeboaphelidium protococcarum]|nr:hypothetical protein MIR68_009270 [Amoeboaphelidium protococcarum]